MDLHAGGFCLLTSEFMVITNMGLFLLIVLFLFNLKSDLFTYFCGAQRGQKRVTDLLEMEL